MSIPANLAEVARRVHPGATLLRAWPLTGGVSAQVTAFEIALSGGETRTHVLRLYGEVDRTQNPDVAAHEFRLLQVLQESGIAAPVPVFFDQSGGIIPTPYIVVGYVEGETASWPGGIDLDRVRQMAAYLARLHEIDTTNADLSFLRRADDGVAARLDNPPAELDDSLHEAAIRQALAAAWPLPQRNRPVLLHGDFWPGNVLWRDGRITAVVDWEDAATGDPQADLANARLEMLWAFGADAMRRFTEHYLSLADADTTHLPYWDLYAALRPIAGMNGWGLDDDTLRSMREHHRWFSSQALDRIADLKG